MKPVVVTTRRNGASLLAGVVNGEHLVDPVGPKSLESKKGSHASTWGPDAIFPKSSVPAGQKTHTPHGSISHAAKSSQMHIMKKKKRIFRIKFRGILELKALTQEDD